MRKFIFILAFILTSQFTANAQVVLMKRANQAFEDMNYQDAITLYSRVLAKVDNSEAKINLAESYRKIGNTQEAEYWLGQIVYLPESESIHKLYYGQMLQTNGKCDLAKEWFRKYVEEMPEDIRGQYLVKACDYADELMTKNESLYEVELAPFNTNLDDFSPMFFQEGIVYSSEYQSPGTSIKRSHAWTGNPFIELYYVPREKKYSKKKEFNYTYGKSKSFSNRLNTQFHDATVTFTKDESEIYFTRNNFNRGKIKRDDDGDIRLKIYSARNNGNAAWQEIEGLPFNSDEYSVAHPALSADGNKLYFSSDMPGGFGGMDLYVTEMEYGRWGPPMNLGPSLNTEGNEVFPYISPNGELYFASDGHVGLGGLDIYHTQIKGGREFGEIINEGYPINSVADDFGIIIQKDGRFGYFSSNRDGGKGGDDIYTFIKKSAPIRLFVYNEKTGAGVKGAKVTNECTGQSYTTDATGVLNLEQKLEMCCNFTVELENFEKNSKETCTINLEKGEGVITEIPLGKPLIFNIEGVVYDKKTRKPLSNAFVELLPKNCDIPTQKVKTDREGKYRFSINKNCCYQVKTANNHNYLPFTSPKQCGTNLRKGKQIIQQDLALQMMPPPVRPAAGIVSTTTPRTKPKNHSSIANNYTDNKDIVTGKPRTKTTLEHFGEGRTLGTYLIHIYYDFDQYLIREDAIPELTKLYQLLVDNPQYVVEVGSHTDSRGPDSYNYGLSQRRAEAVAHWLKEKGIAPERVQPKGYGETVNVNNCSNDVPCSEEEHQWNRRTEFKILGNLDTTKESSKVTKSAQPQKIDVDACDACPF